MKNIFIAMITFLTVCAYANAAPQNLGITADQLSTASVCTVTVSRGAYYHPASWSYAMKYRVECNNDLRKESDTTYFEIPQTKQLSQKFMDFVEASGFKKADPFLSVYYTGSNINPISNAAFYFVKK